VFVQLQRAHAFPFGLCVLVEQLVIDEDACYVRVQRLEFEEELDAIWLALTKAIGMQTHSELDVVWQRRRLFGAERLRRDWFVAVEEVFEVLAGDVHRTHIVPKEADYLGEFRRNIRVRVQADVGMQEAFLFLLG